MEVEFEWIVQGGLKEQTVQEQFDAQLLAVQLRVHALVVRLREHLFAQFGVHVSPV